LLAALSCVLLFPALTAGLQMDDWFQHYKLLGYQGSALDLFVFYDGDAANNRELMQSGSLPWWAAEEFRHANLRYLSTLTMMLDHFLWPDSPRLMHLHSLL
jgi:hypothetical protein